MSSVSSISALPSPVRPPRARYEYRTDARQGLQPRTSHTGTSTGHPIRHSPTSSSGSRLRSSCWEHQDSLPSSSKNPYISGSRVRIPIPSHYRHAEGHDARRVSAHAYSNSSAPRAKDRSYSDVGLSSCNEACPAFRASDLGRQTPGFQTHQSQHAGSECSPSRHLTPLLLAEVSPPSSYILPSSLPLSSQSPCFSTSSTPQRQFHTARAIRNKSSPYFTPPASFRSPACIGSPLRVVSPPPEPSTPSHPPHSYASRSHRSSPPPPRTFTIRRGLVPLRAVPTLAMSMQVYAPTPIRSPRPLSPAVPSSNVRPRSESRPGPSSRPSSPLTQLPSLPSPQRPPMNRPSSRSERLLRDTLRRAEEQERLLNLATLPSSPPFCSSPPLHSPHLSSTVAHMFNASCQMPSTAGEGRRHRRSTSSSIQSDASADVLERSPQLNVAEMADEEDEADDDWYWRERSGASVSSSSSGHGPSYGQTYHCESDNRRKSLDKENGNGGVAYGSPMSLSPARPQLQRSGKSSPNVPRRTHAHTKSASHAVSRTSLDGERSPRRSHQPGALLTPHEAVLRSRLEGVLRGAKVQERKTRSTERGDSQVGSGSGSGSGNSMASSRNLSGEGDFFFGDSSLTSQVSNDLRPTPPAARARTRTSFSPSRPGPTGLDTLPRLPRTPQKPSSRGSKSSSGSPSPLTPPPSPPFNARHAAAQVKTMDGYISFATIEGLGVPDGADDDGSDEDSKARSRWWQWLHLASGKAGDGARIDNANSAASH